jgi:hypothetical protein
MPTGRGARDAVRAQVGDVCTRDVQDAGVLLAEFPNLTAAQADTTSVICPRQKSGIARERHI